MGYGVRLSYPSVFNFVLRSFSFFVVLVLCANNLVCFLCHACLLRVFIFMTPLLPLFSSAKSFVCCYRACLLIGF